MQATGDGVRLRCVLSYSLHTLKITGHHLGSLVWKLVWRSWAHTQGFSGVPTFYRTMLEEAGRELCSILLLQGVPALHGSSSLHTCLPILASAADSCVSCDTTLSCPQSSGTGSEDHSAISSLSVPWLLLGLQSQGLSVTVIIRHFSLVTSDGQAMTCAWPPSIPHKIN